ncbi:MAG: HIT domain-containing protein [Thermoleophilia bacterium]|nr:HIT domain-containing protein [Thermoleophilia bacterium]
MWAPWRMPYVSADRTRADGDPRCVLCDLPAHGDDLVALILARGEHCFVILNAYPYAPGHMMVVPYAHLDRLADLSRDALVEMMELTRTAQTALDATMRPHGFNIGMNQGVAAGAGIADHLHLHVVPRWSGDTNFMPVTGDVRVIPAGLDETYAVLRPEFTT